MYGRGVSIKYGIAFIMYTRCSKVLKKPNFAYNFKRGLNERKMLRGIEVVESFSLQKKKKRKNMTRNIRNIRRNVEHFLKHFIDILYVISNNNNN